MYISSLTLHTNRLITQTFELIKEKQIIFTYSTINKFYIKINNYYYSSLLNNITKPYLNNIYIYMYIIFTNSTYNYNTTYNIIHSFMLQHIFTIINKFLIIQTISFLRQHFIFQIKFFNHIII